MTWGRCNPSDIIKPPRLPDFWCGGGARKLPLLFHKGGKEGKGRVGVSEGRIKSGILFVSLFGGKWE